MSDYDKGTLIEPLRAPTTNAECIRNASDDTMPDEIMKMVFELFEDGFPSRAVLKEWLRRPAGTEERE